MLWKEEERKLLIYVSFWNQDHKIHLQENVNVVQNVYASFYYD